MQIHRLLRVGVQEHRKPHLLVKTFSDVVYVIINELILQMFYRVPRDALAHVGNLVAQWPVVSSQAATEPIGQPL